jgi:hypothetical protein
MMPKSKRVSLEKRAIESMPTAKPAEASPKLLWLRAEYHFHTFAYRDPRSAFSSAIGLPVVSPTTVLLGIASTLFSLGRSDEAVAVLDNIHHCRVAIDPPEGMIFFRAFHQIRRYETDKYRKTKGPNPRIGLTDINQGTREYGVSGGNLIIYIGTPDICVESTRIALRNRDHLGTHDSMCSLVGDVEECAEPSEVVYFPVNGHQFKLTKESPVTIVTLSRFKDKIHPTVGRHWWMAGGNDTELVPYVIQGSFRGTTRGKIYRKN